MSKEVQLLVGTKKGVFIIDGDKNRNNWSLRGPFCEAWPINHVTSNPKTGVIYAGGANAWFGHAVWKSKDSGMTWTHSSKGLNYPEGEQPLEAVWCLKSVNGRLFAGVQPAGLFESTDDGETWTHLDGLQSHPSRPNWMPGGAGLILHHILCHPTNHEIMWVGISSVGVFQTTDGGKNWHTRNKGIRCDFLPEDQRYPDFGQCVHSLVMAPDNPDLLYQQNHCGMYKSENGGQDWLSIEKGLPSSFGFPAATHPRDPNTLYLLPLNGDSVGRYMPDGNAAMWRTQDQGKSWQDFRNGLPQGNAYFGVLRKGLTTDCLSPVGVYFGTSSGSIFFSPDEGENWIEIVKHLPTISSVEVRYQA